MEKQVGFCDMKCYECPVFIITQNNDEAARKELYNKFLKDGIDIKFEDIYCVGCRNHGKVFIHCANCNIRKDAMNK